MIENIELANERGYLWPPIADALDTYLRRKASAADGYELTWRLIHVWEAIATTLAAAATTRVREAKQAPLFRRCREHYHGRSWDNISQSFNRSQGALDGSATRRIDILWDFSGHDASETPYLSALRTFLMAQAIDLRELALAWARICDVPAEARKEGLYTVREAMRHINTFRNRFAHVPFPYDVMEDVAFALESCTEQLLTIEPRPCQMFPNAEMLESPLCGAIVWGQRSIRGNSTARSTFPPTTTSRFCYPPLSKKETTPDLWDAEPFLFVDSMLRPYVLTRLRSSASAAWEFTRFRAEANSVVMVERPVWLTLLPDLTQSEYVTLQDREEKAEEAALSAQAAPASDVSDGRPATDEATTFEEALRFIRNDDYEPAIKFLARLVELRPDYHIGWLRLGHAQRELAMRKRLLEPEAAAYLFDDSVHALTRATEHVHPGRRAQGFYERSKAYYHRGRFLKNAQDLEKALADAREAYEISSDSQYESWIDYLAKHVPPA